MSHPWSRGRVELALWRHTATARYWGADHNHIAGVVPRVFRSRIQKLLNFDRLPDLMPWPPQERSWAFFDAPGEGVGTHDQFSDKHVFLLGVALQLVELGLKQTDAVFFVQHTRKILEAAFDQMHERPNAAAPVSGVPRRHTAFEDDGSSEPIVLCPPKPPLADRTVWMLIRRHEVIEVHLGFKEKRADRAIPLFIEPAFHFGLEAVKEAMFKQLHDCRNVILIELADLALTLPKYLKESPVVRRGRPSHSKTASPTSDRTRKS